MNGESIFGAHITILAAMIIITMAPSDTPTTSTTCSSSHDTKAMEHQRVPPVLYSNSSTNENSNSSSVSVRVSGALSNISRNNITKRNRRVSFGIQQNAYFTPEQQLTTEERKNECWYSEVELNASREDARMAIQALHHQLQMDAAAAAAGTYNYTTGSETEDESSSSSSSSSDCGSDDSSSTSSFDGNSTNSNNNNNSSWVLRCPQDKTKIVCLRGIEKYADAAAKYTGQKRLVRSVLQQQSLNNKDVHISLVSRMLSEPFKEVARYYAMKSADELDLSRKLEEEEQQEMERKQREEVASVLLLIMGMGQQQQRQQQNDVPTSPSSTNLKMPISFSSPIVTPRGGSTSTIPSLKRNSPTNCPSLCKRNVKRCIR